MKYVASRTRPDKKLEYIALGCELPELKWTLNFLKAVKWDDAATIQSLVSEKKFPPEVKALPMGDYDGRHCPFCLVEAIKLDGTARDMPRSLFDVECRSCGRKWSEVFKFETVEVN